MTRELCWRHEFQCLERFKYPDGGQSRADRNSKQREPGIRGSQPDVYLDDHRVCEQRDSECPDVAANLHHHRDGDERGQPANLPDYVQRWRGDELTFSYVDGALSINKVTLTVTAENKTKVYGAALPALTVTYSGFVGGDSAASLGGTLSVTTTATVTSPVGTYPITASGYTSSNYTIIYVPGTLTVSKAPSTITSAPSTKVYGSPNPAFTVTYATFVTGDTEAVLSGTLVFTTTATTASAVGDYDVTPSGLTSANYDITFVKGTLTVTKAPLTVTAAPSTKVYGAPNPAFTVTYATFVTGDTPASLAGTLAFTPRPRPPVPWATMT